MLASRMSMQDRVAKLNTEFLSLSDWEDRYKCIIQKGKQLEAFPEQDRKDENKVRGCQSQVWIHAEFNPETKKIHFYADSDALIVKGLVALLLEVYSDSTPNEILQTPVSFLKKLGLDQHLSPSRANGLYSMVKQIIFYAVAFNLKS